MPFRSVVLAVAGSGYSTDDVLILQGGTSSVPIKIRVEEINGLLTGSIKRFSVVQYGVFSVLPSGTNIATTVESRGANPLTKAATQPGKDAQFTVVWGVKTVTVETSGDYSVLPPGPVGGPECG